jgi:integrase
MYIYPDRKSPYYHAEIWIDGRKYRRSTKCTNRRQAEAAARRIEADLRSELNAQAAAGASLQLADVAARYMLDIGDHHAGADNTDRLVKLILSQLGATTLLTEITHDDVRGLIRWRRSNETGPAGARRPISTRTVNDTTEQLKKLFTYVKASGVAFPREPKWRELCLDEEPTVPRELSPNESDALAAAVSETREGYAELFRFARLSGKRKTEVFTLEWDHVKWDQGIIERPGKGKKVVLVDITDDIRALLWPLYERRNERCGTSEAARYVFTFTAERTLDKIIKGRRHQFVAGKRFPITRDGLRRVWDNLRSRAGLTGAARFRFHDMRHDLATKVLRKTGNLKLTAKLLDHANTATVDKTYAHVTRSDTASALTTFAAELRGRNKKPRKNPRNASTN